MGKRILNPGTLYRAGIEFTDSGPIPTLRRAELINITNEFAVYYSNRKSLPPNTQRRELLFGPNHCYCGTLIEAIAWLQDKADSVMDEAIQKVDQARALRVEVGRLAEDNYTKPTLVSTELNEGRN